MEIKGKILLRTCPQKTRRVRARRSRTKPTAIAPQPREARKACLFPGYQPDYLYAKPVCQFQYFEGQPANYPSERDLRPPTISMSFWRVSAAVSARNDPCFSERCRSALTNVQILFLVVGSAAQPWEPITNYFEFKSNPPSTLLQSTYSAQALELLTAREATIGSISSKEDWTERQAKV